jgi:hypothetical protein
MRQTKLQSNEYITVILIKAMMQTPEENSADTTSDELLRLQHEQFRLLVRHLVRQRLRHNYVKKDDWVVQCFRSIEEFETKFPDPVERSNMLEDLAYRHDRIAAAVEVASERIFHSIDSSFPSRR